MKRPVMQGLKALFVQRVNPNHNLFGRCVGELQGKLCQEQGLTNPRLPRDEEARPWAVVPGVPVCQVLQLRNFHLLPPRQCNPQEVLAGQ